MLQDTRALSGISKLHEDILLELFRLCHDIDVPHAVSWNGTNLRLKYDLGWVRLTHVSSLWRRILLAASFLWADLVCALPPAGAVAVARARGCPLILDDELDLPPDMSPQDAYAFRDCSIKNISSAPYLSRSLRIAQRMAGCDWTHALSGLNFPDLRDLHIIQNPPHPPNPILINAPELQVVSLNHFPATFTAKNIRQLSLLGGDELQLGSSWKLIETLDALPLLEHVTLVFFPMHPIEWCGSDAPRAHLDRLTSIRLIGTLSADLASLWHRIDCPRSVVFDADLLDWRNEGWRSYVNTFAPLLSGREDSRALDINLSEFDDELYHLSFSTHRSPNHEDVVSSVTLRVDKHDVTEMKSAISAFASHLGRAFDALSVQLCEDVGRSDGLSLCESLNAFSSLTHIITLQPDVLEGLLALSSTAFSITECQFPSLNTLSTGLNLRGATTPEEVLGRCRALFAILHARRRLNHPILTVYLVEGPDSCTATCPDVLKRPLSIFRGLLQAVDDRIKLYARFNEEE